MAIRPYRRASSARNASAVVQWQSRPNPRATATWSASRSIPVTRAYPSSRRKYANWPEPQPMSRMGVDFSRGSQSRVYQR